jgi:hypothetical protein
MHRRSDALPSYASVEAVVEAEEEADLDLGFPLAGTKESSAERARLKSTGGASKSGNGGACAVSYGM